MVARRAKKARSSVHHGGFDPVTTAWKGLLLFFKGVGWVSSGAVQTTLAQKYIDTVATKAMSVLRAEQEGLGRELEALEAAGKGSGSDAVATRAAASAVQSDIAKTRLYLGRIYELTADGNLLDKAALWRSMCARTYLVFGLYLSVSTDLQGFMASVRAAAKSLANARDKLNTGRRGNSVADCTAFRAANLDKIEEQVKAAVNKNRARSNMNFYISLVLPDPALCKWVWFTNACVMIGDASQALDLVAQAIRPPAQVTWLSRLLKLVGLYKSNCIDIDHVMQGFAQHNQVLLDIKDVELSCLVRELRGAAGTPLPPTHKADMEQLDVWTELVSAAVWLTETALRGASCARTTGQGSADVDDFVTKADVARAFLTEDELGDELRTMGRLGNEIAKIVAPGADLSRIELKARMNAIDLGRRRTVRPAMSPTTSIAARSFRARLDPALYPVYNPAPTPTPMSNGLRKRLNAAARVYNAASDAPADAVRGERHVKFVRTLSLQVDDAMKRQQTMSAQRIVSGGLMPSDSTVMRQYLEQANVESDEVRNTGPSHPPQFPPETQGGARSTRTKRRPVAPPKAKP
jgi:hypothetical protein